MCRCGAISSSPCGVFSSFKEVTITPSIWHQNGTNFLAAIGSWERTTFSYTDSCYSTINYGNSIPIEPLRFILNGFHSLHINVISPYSVNIPVCSFESNKLPFPT